MTTTLSLKTEENRKETRDYALSMINNALETATEKTLYSVNAKEKNGKYIIEMDSTPYLCCTKPLTRCQIWFCAGSIDIWYGHNFAKAFDGEKSVIFTSNEFISRTKKKKDGVTLLCNDKERCIAFYDINDFIPTILNTICDRIQGNNANIDTLLSALSVATDNIAKETATAKQTTKKRQTKAKTDSAKTTAKKTDSKAKETAKAKAK